eukprot:5986549-Pyramimonas_sp.AAC.1
MMGSGCCDEKRPQTIRRSGDSVVVVVLSSPAEAGEPSGVQFTLKERRLWASNSSVFQRPLIGQLISQLSVVPLVHAECTQVGEHLSNHSQLSDIR